MLDLLLQIYMAAERLTQAGQGGGVPDPFVAVWVALIAAGTAVLGTIGGVIIALIQSRHAENKATKNATDLQGNSAMIEELIDRLTVEKLQASREKKQLMERLERMEAHGRRQDREIQDLREQLAAWIAAFDFNDGLIAAAGDGDTVASIRTKLAPRPTIEHRGKAPAPKERPGLPATEPGQ